MMSPEQSISEGVRKNGFRILSIADHKPPFAYTVGLMFSQQHPELIILGLPEAGPNILRAIIKLIGEGTRFDAPGEYDVLGVIRVATRPVDSTQHEFFLGYAMGYFREQGRPGGLQAVQVFWPDKDGRFPFMRGCKEQVWAAQPRLDQPLGPLDLKERRAGRGG